jgi:hypothetical protein
MVGKPSVTRPNGQRRVREGLPVTREDLKIRCFPVRLEHSLSDPAILCQLNPTMPSSSIFSGDKSTLDAVLLREADNQVCL